MTMPFEKAYGHWVGFALTCEDYVTNIPSRFGGGIKLQAAIKYLWQNSRPQVPYRRIRHVVEHSITWLKMH
jgi:hypothetical protein